MPLQRQEKEAVVADLATRLGEAQAIVLADYRGLNVAQLSGLRREIRQQGAEIHIVKNSLARLALASAGLDELADWLTGPTAITFLGDDLSTPVKAMLKLAKDSELLEIKGGLLGGRRLDARGAAALASLPTREELLSQFLGLIEAPQTQLVSVIQAPLRDFVAVLDAKVREAA